MAKKKYFTPNSISNLSFIKVHTKPEIPKKKEDPTLLLKFVAKMLAFKNSYSDFLTHNQMASRVFGSGNDTNMGYLSEVTHQFNRYIEFEKTGSKKYRFNIEKIFIDYPHFSDIPNSDPLERIKNGTYRNPTVQEDIKNRDHNSIIKELIRAIEDEIIASKEDRKKHTYSIKRYKELDIKISKGIFDIYLDIQDDEYIKIYEGMPATIKFKQQTYDVEILDFDNRRSILTIHTTYKLNDVLKNENCKVVIDAVWLLEAILKRLQNISYAKDNPISMLLGGDYTPKILSQSAERLITGNLDSFQTNAVQQSIKNSISLIWGPPGTGKSHTLAHFLVNNIIRDQKTLVCCIANVALDSLTKKLIETLEILNRRDNINFKSGEVLRLGFTRDPELTKLDYLFPKSEIIENLRNQIDRINEEISNIEDKESKNKLQSKRTDLKKQISNEIKKTIANAKVIFCTASKMHADSVFEQLHFDYLIIDEASMMSVPHFVVLAENIDKGITVTGDFRQLGPVVLSNTHMAQKWLNMDLFEFTGLKYKFDNFTHKSLVQLKTQRRFNDEICQIINNIFYKGELISIEDTAQKRLIKFPPFKDRVIAYINLKFDNSFKCEITSKHSRINRGSAKYIVNNILSDLRYHPIIGAINIGIVTPYRAQVNEINSLISSMSWDKYFIAKIKVGTIHSFQGSESDLLIYDLVESNHSKLGRLYMHETGERLVNVAISRAKSKLIIVGDIEAITKNSGSNNLRQKVFKVFEKLQKYSFR